MTTTDRVQCVQSTQMDGLMTGEHAACLQSTYQHCSLPLPQVKPRLYTAGWSSCRLSCLSVCIDVFDIQDDTLRSSQLTFSLASFFHVLLPTPQASHTFPTDFAHLWTASEVTPWLRGVHVPVSPDFSSRYFFSLLYIAFSILATFSLMKSGTYECTSTFANPTKFQGQKSRSQNRIF